MAADLPDWARVAIEALVALGAGAFGATFRAGRRSALHEQKLQADNDKKIDTLRDELRTDMGEIERAAADSRELLVGQFKESFEGLRRQFDDHRLATEQNFVRRDDFKEFREEIRDDMREIKQLISQITRQ